MNDIDVNDEQNDRFNSNVVAFQNETIDIFNFFFSILLIENFEFDVFDRLSLNNDVRTIVKHI